MEGKVGQFVRFEIIESEKTYLGEIAAQYDGNMLTILDESYSVFEISADKVKIIGEPKDNLEDLLEVNDIVHYENVFHSVHYQKEYIYQRALRDKSIESFKKLVKDGSIKITAIELHENRNVQVVKHDDSSN